MILFSNRTAGPIDAATAAMLRPMVEKLSFVRSINEAWALIAILTLVALLSLPFIRKVAAPLDAVTVR